MRVRAVDADTGRNGQVKYEMTAYASAEIKRTFGVHPLTGAITLLKSRATDKEDKEWLFSVRAYDQSWPATTIKSSVCQVSVKRRRHSNNEAVESIGLFFFEVDHWIETLTLTQHKLVYMNRRVPKNTAIGVCVVDYVGVLLNSTLLYLDEWQQQKIGVTIFSSDVSLDKLIRVSLAPSWKDAKKRLFLLRTRVDLMSRRRKKSEHELKSGSKAVLVFKTVLFDGHEVKEKQNQIFSPNEKDEEADEEEEKMYESHEADWSGDEDSHGKHFYFIMTQGFN